MAWDCVIARRVERDPSSLWLQAAGTISKAANTEMAAVWTRFIASDKRNLSKEV